MGLIVGDYIDSSGTQHGFLYNSGNYTTLNDPLGTDGTVANGINDAGQIVGYYVDSSGTQHGFLYSGGVYTTIDDALGTDTQLLTGINNAGEITGYYTDSSGTTQASLRLLRPTTSYTFNTVNDPSGAERHSSAWHQ